MPSNLNQQRDGGRGNRAEPRVDRAASGQIRISWRPVPDAIAYAVEWLDEEGEWAALALLEEAHEVEPDASGLIQFVDKAPATNPPNAYRVVTFFDDPLTSDGLPSIELTVPAGKE